MNKLTTSLTLLLVVSLSHSSVSAAPPAWNEFRGPGGSGVLEASRPPPAPSLENAAWSVDVPPGHSSPILTERHVVLTAVEGERLTTLAYDRATGTLSWRRESPKRPFEKFHEASSPAASTPCADDERIYVYFGSYGLLAYDHSGRIAWERPLDTPRTLYGMSASPILHGDLLIQVIDDDRNLPDSKVSRSRILAVDKRTGKTAWETPRPFHRSGWSTPTIWRHTKGTELVVLGSGRLRGYDAASGAEKWYVGGFSRETVSRPITGGDVVFASAAMLGGVSDEQPDPEPFWEAILHFDANGDEKLERHEMTEHFTFPLRPDLPPGHPGFGLPLPKDPQKRKGRQDGMFRNIDKDRDGFWTRDEFLGHISFNRGKPNLLAVRPGGEGDVGESHTAWALHRGVPEIPSPVLFRDRIWMASDGGILTCVHARSGEVIYRKRLGARGHFRSSPIIVGGQLWVISEQGVLSVVGTSDEYERHHRLELGERVAATPAVDQATVYVRTMKRLIAFRDEAPDRKEQAGGDDPQSSDGLPMEVAERLRGILRAAIDSGKVAGAVHLVARDGHAIWLQAAGVRDIETKQPLEPDTIVRMYSMTKPITSVAAMQLYEEGKFSLDDPLSRFIPAFEKTTVLVKDGDEVKTIPAKRQITVRDVFRHTTGYSYGDGDPSPRGWYEKEGLLYRPPAGMLPPAMSIEEAAECLARIPALHQPGERFTYGFSTDLLGRLIEIWSGLPLDRYLEKALFIPLEMVDTSFSVPKEKRDRFASCHTTSEGKLSIIDSCRRSPFNEGFEFLSGGGGLVSTTRDYAKFCQMLVNGGEFRGQRILERKTLDLMFSDQLERVPGEFRFGLGFRISEVELGSGENRRLATEYSWGGYASTAFRIVPEERLFQVFVRQHVPSKHALESEAFQVVWRALASSPLKKSDLPK